MYIGPLKIKPLQQCIKYKTSQCLNFSNIVASCTYTFTCTFMSIYAVSGTYIGKVCIPSWQWDMEFFSITFRPLLTDCRQCLIYTCLCGVPYYLPLYAVSRRNLHRKVLYRQLTSFLSSVKEFQVHACRNMYTSGSGYAISTWDSRYGLPGVVRQIGVHRYATGEHFIF